ncbi:MAG: hypothetical protein ABW194_11040, partial [Novosphingobium sp.]
LSLGSATAGGATTLAAATTATLGPVTATGQRVTITAADAAIGGAVAANEIVVIDRATGTNPLRLGTAAGAGAGFGLDQTEINRLNAASVTLDAGTGAGTAQDVKIGVLALDADSGANALSVLGLRRIDVTGAFTATGSGTRQITLGGSGAASSRATVLRVAADVAATAADSPGGRLLMTGVDLTLRADAIGVGRDMAFLDALGVTEGATPLPSAQVTTMFISNPSSTLYGAGPFGVFANPELPLVQVDSLTVSYSNFALFQNTGGVLNRGAIVASLGTPSRPALNVSGSNPQVPGGFAIFGTINGVPDSAAALLGGEVNRFVATPPAATRINGCLVGSSSGCLANLIGAAPLPPLDPIRDQILLNAGNFEIPFDPVVGTNNESLFGDVGSFGLGDLPLSPLECTKDERGQCVAEEEGNQQ